VSRLVLTVDESRTTRFVHINLPDQDTEQAIRNVERTLNRDKTFVVMGDKVVNSMKVSSVQPAEEVQQPE